VRRRGGKRKVYAFTPKNKMRDRKRSRAKSVIIWPSVVSS
jgi:hypothetical protein